MFGNKPGTLMPFLKGTQYQYWLAAQCALVLQKENAIMN